MARVGITRKKKTPRATELSQKEVAPEPAAQKVSAGSKHVTAHLKRSL
jgi:hypothetical protein